MRLSAVALGVAQMVGKLPERDHMPVESIAVALPGPKGFNDSPDGSYTINGHYDEVVVTFYDGKKQVTKITRCQPRFDWLGLIKKKG